MSTDSGERGAVFHEWTEVDFDDRPLYGPHCPGIDTHPWRLIIEEGQMTLSSGCVTCDDGVLGTVGGEDVHMEVAIVGTLKSHLEVSGWETPEYDHWWEFVPEHIGGDRTKDWA